MPQESEWSSEGLEDSWRAPGLLSTGSLKNLGSALREETKQQHDQWTLQRKVKAMWMDLPTSNNLINSPHPYFSLFLFLSIQSSWQLGSAVTGANARMSGWIGHALPKVLCASLDGQLIGPWGINWTMKALTPLLDLATDWIIIWEHCWVET